MANVIKGKPKLRISTWSSKHDRRFETRYYLAGACDELDEFHKLASTAVSLIRIILMNRISRSSVEGRAVLAIFVTYGVFRILTSAGVGKKANST